VLLQRGQFGCRFLLWFRNHGGCGGEIGSKVDRQQSRKIRHPYHAQTHDRCAAPARAEGKDYRAFEILNLGKYERQHFIGINHDLREEQKQQQIAAKEAAFLDLILRAYRAEKTDGFATFNGKRAGRLVAIGPVNLPVTRLFVEEIILECRNPDADPI